MEKLENSSHDNSKVIEKLQHDLMHLNKERRGVIEAILSCDVADIVGDSPVEMVTSLCDQVTMIAALSSSKENSAETLKRQIKTHEDDDTKLATTLVEYKGYRKKTDARRTRNNPTHDTSLKNYTLRTLGDIEQTADVTGECIQS